MTDMFNLNCQNFRLTVQQVEVSLYSFTFTKCGHVIPQFPKKRNTKIVKSDKIREIVFTNNAMAWRRDFMMNKR